MTRFARLAGKGMAWAAACLVLGGAASADTQDELWPETNAFFKLDDRFRLYLHTRLTYSPASWTPDGTSSFQEVEAAPGLDISIKRIRPPRTAEARLGA